MIELNTQRILKIQIIVGIVAVAITVFSLFQLAPLIEKQAELKADIEALEAKRTELQRDNNLLSRAAKPAEKSSQQEVEAWLYVGRASSGAWAPRADGVVPVPTPTATQDFGKVSTTKNVTLVGQIESALSSISASEETVQLVKAGTELNVLELKTQPSIGGAALVWAKVRVPADKVLEISKK
jgi:hypothetical protein